MRFILLTMAALAWSSPVAAKPTLFETEQAAPVAGADPAQYADAMRAYGEWIVRLGEAQAPLQAHLNGLHGEWQAVLRSRRPADIQRFREHIAEALSRVDAAHDALSSLPSPDVSLIELPDALTPDAIVRNMMRINRELRTAIETFGPAIDATLSGDSAAAEAAVRRMLTSVGLVLESNVVTSRAMLSVASPEDGSWELQNVEHLYFRVAARAFGAWPRILEGRPEPGLWADLLAIADELDATAEAGAAKTDAEAAAFDAELEAMSADPDPAVSEVLRNAAASVEVSGRVFSLARRLAGQIRANKSSHAGSGTDVQSLMTLFSHLREFRSEYDAIVTAIGAAMAGAD